MLSGKIGFIPASWTPKSVAGLAVWLDVSDYGSLTFSGSNVSQIKDLSGNGYHATQSSGTLQPAYQATGLNGKPCVSFNGSQTQKLTTGATIANYINTPTSNPQFTLVSVWRTGVITDGYSVAWGSDLQANGRVFFNQFFGGGSLIFDTVNASAGRLVVTLTKSDYDNTSFVHTAYRNGATMAVRNNGSVVAIKTNASGNFSSTTAKFNVGTADTSGCCALFSEALIYAGALSATDLSAAEKYLGSKWGIAVA